MSDPFYDNTPFGGGDPFDTDDDPITALQGKTRLNAEIARDLAEIDRINTETDAEIAECKRQHAIESKAALESKQRLLTIEVKIKDQKTKRTVRDLKSVDIPLEQFPSQLAALMRDAHGYNAECIQKFETFKTNRNEYARRANNAHKKREDSCRMLNSRINGNRKRLAALTPHKAEPNDPDADAAYWGGDAVVHGSSGANSQGIARTAARALAMEDID